MYISPCYVKCYMKSSVPKKTYEIDAAQQFHVSQCTVCHRRWVNAALRNCQTLRTPPNWPPPCRLTPPMCWSVRCRSALTSSRKVSSCANISCQMSTCLVWYQQILKSVTFPRQISVLKIHLISKNWRCTLATISSAPSNFLLMRWMD